MRRWLALVAAALAVLGACGGDDDVVLEPNPEQDLSMTLRHTQPLRAESPVTWTLEVRNGGTTPVKLAFSSAQRGEVVLSEGARSSTAGAAA